MKKEIEGLVQIEAVSAFEDGHIGDIPFWRIPPSHTSGKYIKATLIIDLPKRTITISESEFDEALKYMVEMTPVTDKGAALLREKLFGEKGK